MATLSVASIAKRAMDKVGAKVSGVIHDATLSRSGPPVYDPETGGFVASTTTDTGRALFDNERPAADLFPDYVPGPGEELAYLEGLAAMVPREGDSLTTAGKVFSILRVGDLLRSGGLYPLVLRSQGAP